MRDEWRSTTTTSGVQCVTTTGRCRRLTSSVGPWDFLGQITRPLKQGIYMHVDLCNSLTPMYVPPKAVVGALVVGSARLLCLVELCMHVLVFFFRVL